MTYEQRRYGFTSLRISPVAGNRSFALGVSANPLTGDQRTLKGTIHHIIVELPESAAQTDVLELYDVANVNEVATIVKEVYHDYLEDANDRNSRQNPLAAMMGGGGNSRSNNNNRGGAPSSVKMTIGVDTQTSKLVVSASDSLFRQVEEMVAELDKSAYDARRTVQVVNVNESSAQVVSQALTALLLAEASAQALPAADYIVRPSLAEGRAPTAVLHHYVAHSKRSYFQHGWRHVLGELARLPQPA